jgi:hypothetical protein
MPESDDSVETLLKEGETLYVLKRTEARFEEMVCGKCQLVKRDGGNGSEQGTYTRCHDGTLGVDRQTRHFVDSGGSDAYEQKQVLCRKCVREEGMRNESGNWIKVVDSDWDADRAKVIRAWRRLRYNDHRVARSREEKQAMGDLSFITQSPGARRMLGEVYAG